MEQLVRYPPAHKNRQGEVEMCLHSPGSRQNYRLASLPAPALRSAGLKHVVLQAVAILVPPPLSLSSLLCCRLVPHRPCRRAAAISQSRWISLACFYSRQRGGLRGSFSILAPGLLRAWREGVSCSSPESRTRVQEIPLSPRSFLV